MENTQSTILVSIPCYRDPECQYTIRDLFLKAKYPERVHVGVCWQVDREVDTCCFLLDLEEYRVDGRLREIFWHHSEARGPCVARAAVEKDLFRGEDYFLQLDSHYRMAECWDEELLTQLSVCSSSRPILTTYPASYTLPDNYEPGKPDAATLRNGQNPIVLCAREFNSSDGFLRISGKACNSTAFGGSPVPSLFWAAGFAFGPAAALLEVPYDPHLEDLFFGEEPSMAARLWTAGWDFFSPTKVLGFHLWTRKHRPVFREHAGAEQKQRENASRDRVRYLLGLSTEKESSLDIGQYGLGTVRTLEEYQKFSGANHSDGTLSDHARRGGMQPAHFINGDPVSSSLNTVTSITAMPAIVGLMPDKVGNMIGALIGATPESSLSHPPCAPPPRLLLVRRLKNLRLLQPLDVDTFNRCGILVIDNFLEQRCYKDCGSDAASRAPRLVHNGAERISLRPAGLGRGEQMWNSSVVRGDNMAWLSAPEGQGFFDLATARVQGIETAETAAVEVPDTSSTGDTVPSDPDLDILLVNFVTLRADLDQLLLPPTSRLSIMTACYPGAGARYARHRDALPDHGEIGKRRRITAVYYLNPDWKPTDGGCLRAFFPADLGREVEGAAPATLAESSIDGDWFLDIEPKMDRLILFPSEFLDHEVLPTQVERRAVTAWFY